jgi:hypothetical protein
MKISIDRYRLQQAARQEELISTDSVTPQYQQDFFLSHQSGTGISSL